MFSFFKKKKIVSHIKLSGVIGNVGKFKEGIQGGAIGPQEDDYYIPDDFNEEDYIDNYFESLEGIN